MHDVQSELQREEVAIIGIAGRFPGAGDVEAFWDNLLQGRESIRPFTEEELRASGVDPAVLKEEGYVNAGAVLEGADAFDADFFGFSPREAEITDPQHRLFLEIAWSALENAGYDPHRFTGAIGVFGGVARNGYLPQNLLTRPDVLATVTAHQAVIGNDKDFPATRVAFKMNLRGPCINVQTACSTSGVAIHLACQSLLSGESDMALAGGVRIKVPLHSGYVYEEGGIQSRDGHCRAFDAQAQGTVIGSGGAMLVLKRLSEAQRDADTIYAVIKGTAVNNDGSGKIGFTAPSVEGQARVVAEAQAVAGVEPETIGYVETHGTGTSLGDPIEIAALTRAFQRQSRKKQYAAIGSLKTNIGHLDAGAGAAGVIKAALAVSRNLIPPSLHFVSPNPQIDFENSPFFVNTTLRPWPITGPRRAGISSFGMGGTNFHAVIEQPPQRPTSDSSVPVHTLVLSGKTASSVQQAAQRLVAALERNHPPLADVAWTLQVGRKEMEFRWSAAARNTEEALQLLRQMRSGEAARCTLQVPEVCFLFTGQGSQRLQMGRELFQTDREFREIVLYCSQVLEPELGGSLVDWMYPAESSEANEQALKQTRLAQPALFVLEFALARLWISRGVRPAALLGHSIGEYVAATLAGVFTLPDALRLVATRGRLMQSVEPGTMVAVRVSEETLQGLLIPGIDLAAINGAELCVASGPIDVMDSWTATLTQKKITWRALQTSHAFHSAMMEPILRQFEEVVASVPRQSPTIPIVSNVTGRWLTDAEAKAPEYWSRHLRSTVRFAEGLQCLWQNPARVLLEIGPGRTLATLALQHPARPAQVPVLPTLPQAGEGHDDFDFAASLGKAWAAGVALDWSAVQRGEKRSRIPLPGYPFERKRFWVEPGQLLAASAPRVTPSEGKESTSAMASDPASGVEDKLYPLLCSLSGMNREKFQPSLSFLELGFDSLFLTQARQIIEREFKVRVAFRQLLEELSSPEKLAAFLKEQMPVAARSEAMAPQPSVEPGNSTRNGQDSPREKEKEKEKDFGPFRPPEKTAATDLTPAQQEFLQSFLDRYARKTPGSKNLTQRFRKTLADPRAVSGFKSVWKEAVYPIYSAGSNGGHVWDIDGNEYIDVTLGFGITLLGHQPASIVTAIRDQLEKGFEIGPSALMAGEVAELVSEFTGLERVTFCNTGSEAVLAAMRIARTVTGRQKIAVFAGSYHGIFDEVLVRRQASNGKSVPIAPGIVPSMTENVVVVPYGDPEALATLRNCGSELAAILVEPVQSKNPDLQPREFLHALRALATEVGAALILDEMITGFRVHPRGAQGWFGVQADIATYGKVVGGGMPLGIVAGKAEFMDALDGGPWQFGDDSFPAVGVTFFAGTFVRHPLALAAAKAMLLELKQAGPGLQADLNRKSESLFAELNRFCAEVGCGIHLAHFGSMFLIKVPAESKYANLLYFHLRHKGILIREGRPNFLCAAHSSQDLAFFSIAFKESVVELQQAGFLPSRNAVQSSATSPTVRRLPLTPAQEELWLATRLGEDAWRSFNDTVLLELKGRCDGSRLEHALQSLVQRHEALRTGFDAEHPEQWIHETASITLHQEAAPAALPDRKAWLLERAATVNRQAFSLAQPPFLRATLVKFGSEDHVLILTTNHLVIDGWSMGLLLRELGELYSGATLQPALSFSKWTEWSCAEPQKQVRSRSLEFWKKKFAPLPQELNLPLDRPRGAQKEFGAARESLWIQGNDCTAIRQAATREKTTLVVFLLASFQAWLARLTQQQDLVVGLPTAAQSLAGDALPGAESLMGHCVHLLPLRCQVPVRGSFRELLGQTRQTLLDAHDHADVTFGTLVPELNLPRDTSRNSLVSVTFNVDRVSPLNTFSGLAASLEVTPKTHNFFDLSFNLFDSESGLRMDCRYNKSLWQASTIQRWLEGWKTLLLAVVTQADQSIARLPVCGPEETKLVREWSSGPRLDVPETSIIETFLKAAERHPNHPAILFEKDSITYGQLRDRAARVAKALRREGVGPEKLVGVYQERKPDLIASLLGILWAGGAYLPLDPTYPAERTRQILESARPHAVLASRNVQATLPHLASTPAPRGVEGGEKSPHFITLEEVLSHPGGGEEPIVPNGKSFNLAYVIYTSGSTGRPKGVAIEQRQVVAFLEWARQSYQPGDWNGVLFSTSICFDISVFEIFGTLCSGGTLILAENVLQVGSLPAANQITLINTVPSAMQELIHSEMVPASVRVVNLAGEPLATALVDEIYQLPGVERVYDLYGPTETTVYATGSIREAGRPATIGKPLSNTQVAVFDAENQPVPIGVPGELWITGAGVGRGYFGQETLTQERFVTIHDPTGAQAGRYYRTGDLCRWRPDGNLEFLGRIDHQVKIRGYRIELGEIEIQLSEHEAVAETALFTTSDGRGEILAAAVVLRPGQSCTTGDLRRFLQARLPDYMIPSNWLTLEKLPRNANGKLDRKRLIELAQATPEQTREDKSQPDSPVEEFLQNIWAELLKKAPSEIGMDDNFFELGGHSLLLTRLLARLRREVQVELPLREVFKSPTIRAMAEAVETELLRQPAEQPASDSQNIVART